jgi:hypothetical protein
VHETQVSWTDIPTREKADETELGNEPLRRMCGFDAHRFIGDPAVTRKERQRLADVRCGGKSPGRTRSSVARVRDALKVLSAVAQDIT